MSSDRQKPAHRQPPAYGWYFITLSLYLLSLIVLVMPSFAFGNAEELGMYVIFALPIYMLIQAAFLIVPVRMAQGRPIKRRAVAVTVIACGLAVAILYGSFVICVIELIESVGRRVDGDGPIVALGLIPVIWIVSGIIFYLGDPYNHPTSFISKIANWLLVGSILELIVAIPAHIASRSRDTCCATPTVLLGISTGMSIALLSYGPALFFLYAKKMKQKTKAQRTRSDEPPTTREEPPTPSTAPTKKRVEEEKPANIRFACPGCGLHYSGAPGWVGRKLECRSCGAQMEVPAKSTID